MGLKEWLEDEYDDGMEAGKAIGMEEGKTIGIAEGKTIGIAEGKTIGIAVGRKEVLLSQVKKKLEKGNTLEEIADILEEDISVIAEIINELKESK